VHLVEDHVLQLLVVDGTVVDVGLQRLAGNARCEHVFALKWIVNENPNYLVESEKFTSLKL
jgi:hypothetical protein